MLFLKFPVARLAALLLCGLFMPALAAQVAEPFGLWATADGESRIKIAACGAGKLCGTLVGLSEPNDANGPKRDSSNADPALRQRPMIGIQLLLGLERKGDIWKGKMYNPEDGKIYDGSFALTGPDTAAIQGCVAFVLCQSEVLLRQ